MSVNVSNVHVKLYQSMLSFYINLKWMNQAFIRYFVTMLIYFSSAPFYTNNIHLPNNQNTIPPEI